MPAFPSVEADFLLNPGTAVSPITGNTGHGSAAYDPATGQALYAVYSGSDFKLYRTTEGYKQLALEDDSVTEVATIAAGPFGKARNIGLTWIDGTLYALINGIDIGNVIGGAWIYKATNTALTSWTQHGIVYQSSQVSSTTSEVNEFPDARWGGEILVFPNGNWSVTHSIMDVVSFGGSMRPENRAALSTSTDGGETFSVQHNIKGNTAGSGGGPGTGYGVLGALFNASNCYGELDGNYYCGFVVNSGFEFHFVSSDGTWTRMTSFGEGGNAGHKWPFSVGDTLYEERSDLLRYTTSDPALNTYTSTGVDLNDYGLTVTNDAAPHVCNIHHPNKPYLIATKLGKVVGIGKSRAGWTIGRVGPTW